MKLKYYLRGIGIGMIVTTVVLMIAFSVHKDQSLTDEEIMARAAELGMVMQETQPTGDKLSDTQSPLSDDENSDDEYSDDKNSNDEKSDDGKSDEIKTSGTATNKTETTGTENSEVKADGGEGLQSLQTDAVDEEKKESSSKTSDSNDSEKEEKKTQEEPEVVEQVEITIVGGEYSDAVCRKLKKAGVIENVDDFNKYLTKGGYDNLIQPGNYVIPLDADYKTIVKLITEKKDKKKR